MGQQSCPFCSINAERIVHADKLVLAIWDGFPITSAHALIIPKRHISTWFDATPAEQAAMLNAITVVRDSILEHHQPDGFNIGINDGPSAGQTIPHLHLHVIPR